MPATPDRLARFRTLHAAALDHAATLDPAAPTIIPDAVVRAVGAETAAAFAEGVTSARQLRANRNRDEVGRLSRAGMRVGQIAAATGLSRSYVCALRAQLGIGRRP